jgi:hypothetical protein
MPRSMSPVYRTTASRSPATNPATSSNSVSISYAPPKNPTKQWPQEVQMEGWFPPGCRQHTDRQIAEPRADLCIVVRECLSCTGRAISGITDPFPARKGRSRCSTHAARSDSPQGGRATSNIRKRVARGGSAT